MQTYQRVSLLLVVLICIGFYEAHGGLEADARITDLRIRSDKDSTGRKIKRMTICTEQKNKPMWGVLTVSVAVRDAEGKFYFGSASVKQPSRSGYNSWSKDAWEFHIVTDGISNPDLIAYLVRYTNSDNDEVLDQKDKNVANPEEWLRDSQSGSAAPLEIEAESHVVRN